MPRRRHRHWRRQRHRRWRPPLRVPNYMPERRQRQARSPRRVTQQSSSLVSFLTPWLENDRRAGANTLCPSLEELAIGHHLRCTLNCSACGTPGRRWPLSAALRASVEQLGPRWGAMCGVFFVLAEQSIQVLDVAAECPINRDPNRVEQRSALLRENWPHDVEKVIDFELGMQREPRRCRQAARGEIRSSAGVGCARRPRARDRRVRRRRRARSPSARDSRRETTRRKWSSPGFTSKACRVPAGNPRSCSIQQTANRGCR